MGLKIFFRRSLLLGISMFAVVPVLVLAASPPWESDAHAENCSLPRPLVTLP